MSSKERIMIALEKGQPDRVPIFELGMNNISILRLANLLLGAQEDPDEIQDIVVKEVNQRIWELYCYVVEKLGLDATSSGILMGLKQIDEKRAKDKYGIIYDLSIHGLPIPKEGPIKNLSDVKGFDMTLKLEAEDFAMLQNTVSILKNKKAHFLSIPDPFKISWGLLGGMDKLFIAYVDDPKLVHELARIATDFYIAAVDIGVEIGVDVFVVVGDLAGEQNVLISRKHFQEYLMPYYKKIVDYIHKKDKKAVKHSDGNIWAFLDDLVEIGFDGIHPIQPQCMDIVEVKQYLQGKMCVIGNIDVRDLLPSGTKKKVEETVKETIKKVAPGGGYIISSSNTIHPGCNPENYVTAVKSAHKYGKYPELCG